MEPNIPNGANKPEKKFSAGAIAATIWQNQGKSRTGETVAYRTISLQRSYKDKDGTWKSTNSFRVNDLPRAAVVLQKAYEHIILKEAGTSASSISQEEEIIM